MVKQSVLEYTGFFLGSLTIVDIFFAAISNGRAGLPILWSVCFAGRRVWNEKYNDIKAGEYRGSCGNIVLFAYYGPHRGKNSFKVNSCRFFQIHLSPLMKQWSEGVRYGKNRLFAHHSSMILNLLLSYFSFMKKPLRISYTVQNETQKSSNNSIQQVNAQCSLVPFSCQATHT